MAVTPVSASSIQRTVMISGANRGIGRAIAERCLLDGHRLSLGCREPHGLDASPFGQQEAVACFPYEARDPQTASTWVRASVERFGAVDALVNAAGALASVPFLFEPGADAAIRELFDINVMGPWWLSRAAWPHLAASGHGRVVNLVSMSGKRVKGSMAAYPVSKFALLGLGQAMRNSGWDAGIRVTSLCPGWVNTDMAAGKGVPAAAMAQPQDLAELVATLLRLPNAAVPHEIACNCILEP
ncbi:MAG: SDR family NAD(P)-dependent oxidoreductase [Aphanocapsa feldmannii 277cV]|uniref:SDR family NAD(P)-dependent oxidoreductase n=2 Tax=Aphanocapsa feldmannii TaxID=192050 RepID=A0A524RLN7_9CHRO|nr:MAG: SDR family NAD(P)-dependent oxidoreductase [Aphanocapsa feldmannii 288cV]TGG90952.1 MAG: SDR family NAD(P)-dependent oxidoreductase [Aphanocapsa feldmannii 277cV]